jgi:succinoglycan biosynthesis transport protein ExoP
MDQNEISRTRNGNGNGGALGDVAQPGPHRRQAADLLPQQNLLLILWRGRWIVLLCSVLSVGAALYYLSRQTSIFSSTSRILVENDSPRIMNNEARGPAVSGNYLRTQCELLRSAKILSPVAERPELRSMRTFAGASNPLGVLKAGMTAEVGRNDDLITVSFESPYPADAAAVVTAVVDSYKQYHLSKKRSSTDVVLNILTTAKPKADADLKELQQKMQAFKQSHPNLSYTGEKGNMVLDELSKLRDALATVRLQGLEARGELEAAKAMAFDPARMEQWLRLQQGGPGGALQTELERLEVELAPLRGNALPGHSSVKAMETRIEELRKKIAEQAQENFAAYLAALEQRVTTAARKEAELDKSFGEQQKQAVALNSDSTVYSVMESEAKRLERFCEQLGNRIEEVKITESAEPITITLLEQARPGLVPIRPKRSTVLFQALMLGLVVGSGLAYLRDFMDQRLASADEIQGRLGLNILGVLPHMSGRETASVRGMKVQLDPMSDVAEAYRTVRTAIYFGAPEGKTKTILVTSPSPGDGKSTTASNVAIAMAQAGRRVLLIDCDFRKPMQHRVFGLEDGAGLSNLLALRVRINDAVKSTSTPGLYLLPCGPIPANPSELLSSENFALLLSKLQDKFHHIVIDSPPVMPVADARILGAFCDMTVLVLRAGKSTRRMSVQACDSLLSVGSRILGVVVNDVPRGRGRYGYTSYGYSGYGYGNRYGKPSYALESRPKGPDDNGAAHHPGTDEVRPAEFAESVDVIRPREPAQAARRDGVDD